MNWCLIFISTSRLILIDVVKSTSGNFYFIVFKK